MKKTFVLFFVLSCLGFFSCASNAFIVSAPAKVPNDFFGISPDRSPLNREDFQLLDEFNAVWIRSTIRWSGVEREEGVWNFESWDNYVAKAEAANKKVILVLGFDNPYLHEDNREKRAFTERELPYFLNYVEQVVRRYGTRVVYEIWNEPNWVFWKGSKKQFYPVSKAAAQRIREVQPDALILAGSTSRYDRRFTRGMFETGAMEYTDGFSFHPYATSPLGTARQIDKLQKTMDKYNYDKPVWVTEAGFSTGPISFCNINRYAEYIIKTLSAAAIRSDNIRNLIWYELMDNYNKGEVPNPLHPLNYFGLIYPNGDFKPGAHAFMLASTHLAGSRHNPALPLRENISSSITSLFFEKEDGTNILILWKNGLGSKKLRLQIPDTEKIMLHNIHNREITILQPGEVITVTREPVFITWNGGGSARLRR